MSISITETPNNYEIRFGFNPRIVADVKSIPGRQFMGASKMWTVPISSKPQVEAFRRKYGLHDIDKRAEVYEDIPAMPELTTPIPLRKDLFPFQRTGVAYALEKKRLIIGDQPGLGKTAQAIATLIGANAFPVLIICPSSLKLNWQREIEMWSGKKSIIMTDKVKRTWPEYIRTGMCQIFICNYESLKKYFVAEVKKPTPETPLRLNHIHFHEHIGMFKAVVIDESHRVKEAKAAQTKFTKGIAAGKEYIIALTGTPVVNKPRDLVAQLGIIDQMQNFGGYKGFVNRYCEGYNGAANLKELNFLLNKHCFYRREKTDVLKELPDKMRQIVLCDIAPAQRKEYTEAQNNLEGYLRKYKQATDEKVASALRGEIMVTIGVLKNISARGKLADVIEQVRSVIDEGEKIIVFVHLKEVAAALKEEFPDALTILGDDHIATRQMNVDRFQNDPAHKLIICSIKAAGVGITLTSSSRVAFVELPWHPADCDQCEDRAHRIGQHDSVQCMYFLGKDTIDEHIYQIIDKKRAIADAVTGSTENIQEEVIDIMMSSLFNKNKTNGTINTIRDGSAPDNNDQYSEASTSDGGGQDDADLSEGLFPSATREPLQDDTAGGRQESREGF